jgi:hypothetical protein
LKDYLIQVQSSQTIAVTAATDEDAVEQAILQAIEKVEFEAIIFPNDYAN